MADAKSSKLKHLDITYLPSDPSGMVSTFRTILLRTINSARGSDEKMKLILATLKYAVAHIENGMKTPKKPRKAQEK